MQVFERVLIVFFVFFKEKPIYSYLFSELGGTLGSYFVPPMHFHWIGLLGRVSHRVTMSLCMFVCLVSPPSEIYFEAFHWPWGQMFSFQASHWSIIPTAWAWAVAGLGQYQGKCSSLQLSTVFHSFFRVFPPKFSLFFSQFFSVFTVFQLHNYATFRDAIICTHYEIQCLPYAGFFSKNLTTMSLLRVEEHLMSSSSVASLSRHPEKINWPH